MLGIARGITVSDRVVVNPGERLSDGLAVAVKVENSEES